MPAIKKAFYLMGDDIVEIHTENKSLENKIGSYDEKWLEESKVRLLQQTDDEKRAILTMSRMRNRWMKVIKWFIFLIINYGKASLITSFLKEIIYKI